MSGQGTYCEKFEFVKYLVLVEKVEVPVVSHTSPVDMSASVYATVFLHAPNVLQSTV